MTAPYRLILPSQTRFGRGEAVAAASEIAALGRRVLLVHGASGARAEPVGEALRARGCDLRLTSGSYTHLTLPTICREWVSVVRPYL